MELQSSSAARRHFTRLKHRWVMVLCLSATTPLIFLQLRTHPTSLTDDKSFILPHQFSSQSHITTLTARHSGGPVQEPLIINTRRTRDGGTDGATGEARTVNEVTRHASGQTMKTSNILNNAQIDAYYRSVNNKAHPRVACFGQNDGLDVEANGINSSSRTKSEPTGGSSCNFLTLNASKSIISTNTNLLLPFIPRQSDFSHKQNIAQVESNDNENCTLSDPYQSIPVAPSTCNDVHSLGFGSGMFQAHNLPLPYYVEIMYITSGGAKSVWHVTSLDGESREERFIMKTNKLTSVMKLTYWEQNRRDALVTGAASKFPPSGLYGNQPSSTSTSNITNDLTHSWNHVLPIYHYCALTNLVPYATAGTLNEYVRNYPDKHDGEIMDATDLLRLALQAARGLYQAHLYKDGRATHVHADVNPSQFLLFSSQSSSNRLESMKLEDYGNNSKLPILQINDFNQGRFLTRHVTNGETCPFHSCPVRKRGNRYRSPEFMNCVDQTDKIDVFSLGSVFFFLLSDGLEPYFKSRKYEWKIKNGQLPQLPTLDDYDKHIFSLGGEALFAEKRTDHPAYKALREIMIRCWTFQHEDRPGSFEVAQMLQQKLHEVQTIVGL